MSESDPTPPLRKWSWLGGGAFKFGVRTLLAGACFALLGAPACGNKEPLPAARSGPGSGKVDPAELCATPNQGCPCEGDGEVVECGKVVEKHDDYVTCSLGHRSCDSGSWSECVGERTTQSKVHGPPPLGSSYRIQALGKGVECPPGFDACDPYCHQFVDEPGAFTATGFENEANGLSLAESVAAGCDSLSLSASATTLHVNQLSPLTLQEGAITLTAALTPATCRLAPFKTTWTLDRFDIAQVTGTNNQDGALTLTSPYAGDVVVTAYAAGLEASLTLHVKVNVLEAPGTNALATPNSAATAMQISSFGTVGAPQVGTAATTATWLYPYAATYFPLGLLPPALLYRYSVAGGGAVKVSLRYPTGQTATGADFNYSLIVKEANSISQSAGVAANTLDPQVVVPSIAWQAFEQTARGNNAELIVQRLPASGTLEQATTRPIHFVNGQLKGTVYYNSYSSPQGGDTGAVLSIAPGASSPALAVQPGGNCTVCHSLNVSGTRLITNGAGTPLNQSKRFDLTQGPASSPTVLNNYDLASPPSDVANVPGDRFTYGGPLTDGTFYMTHGGVAGGDQNFRAPPAVSNLYDVNAPNTIVPVTNWPNNVLAVTPRFSVDGTRLSFGFWGGNAVGSLASVAAGTRLAVVDFTCATPPCGTGSSGFAVSNPRDLTPGLTHKAAWPSFSPSGDVVLYQRQYRSSKSLSTWSPSDVNTSMGALAEIWASDVPASSATPATPTALANLNGVGLPTRPRTVVDDATPLYKFPIVRFDMSQSGSASPAGVYLTGTPATNATNALPASDIRVKITVGGTLGNAKFRYSTNGGVSYSGTDLTTSATPVALGTNTGLSAVFVAGTYVAGGTATVYQALVGYVSLAGTPQGGPWDFRLNITTTGVVGTSRFRYSTNGGTSWTGPLATGSSVSLGTTGMVASFAAATYSSTTWAWGALVSNYHDANASFTINIADNCRSSVTASNVNDSQLNYVPSVNPTEAGDMTWVVFTSRRMYGNVAYDDPWDAEPAATNHTHYTCNSSTPPTKKLWVSALNKNFTGGMDPSHPAFYLPGQELAAGNSHAYWVSTPCAQTGETCSTSDDCCNGSGADPDARCNGSSKLCQSIDDCAPAAGGCATSADCCEGLICNGAGQCASPVFYSTETYEREYIAECADGYKVAWRDFEWQATIPTGTSIDLAVQTKPEEDALYEPDPGASLDSISETTMAGEWVHGSTTVDEALASADVGSRSYLRVSMTFNPDADGQISPVLTAWRQNYDCLPAE